MGSKKVYKAEEAEKMMLTKGMVWIPGKGYAMNNGKEFGEDVEFIINDDFALLKMGFLPVYVTRLEELEQLAPLCYGSSATIEQINNATMGYIRSQVAAYTGHGWDVTAGEIDDSYVRFVNSRSSRLQHFFERTHPAEFYNTGVEDIINTGGNVMVDIPHMIATIDGIISPNNPDGFVESLGFTLYDISWPGWGGDLQTGLLDMINLQRANPSRPLQEIAREVIGSNAYRISAADIYSDVDGHNIARMMLQDPDLLFSQAMANYYGTERARMRFIEFLNSYEIDPEILSGNRHSEPVRNMLFPATFSTSTFQINYGRLFDIIYDQTTGPLTRNVTGWPNDSSDFDAVRRAAAEEFIRYIRENLLLEYRNLFQRVR